VLPIQYTSLVWFAYLTKVEGERGVFLVNNPTTPDGQIDILGRMNRDRGCPMHDYKLCMYQLWAKTLNPLGFSTAVQPKVDRTKRKTPFPLQDLVFTFRTHPSVVLSIYMFEEEEDR
jgi:hypothetical protein